MFTSLLMKGLTGFLTKAIVAVASEKMVSYTFFRILEAMAETTATPHDDEWVARMKAAYAEQA